jgi:hypothetical protein
MPRMGISVSILLIAAGAILTWGVTAEAEGLDVNAIGVILLIVGLLGLVLSLIFWSSWGGFRRPGAYVERGAVVREPVVRESVVHETVPRRRATTVVEEDDVAPGPPPP